jgi:flagellar protein FliO/FliZ
LGGEKLKSSRLYFGILLFFLFFIAGFFGVVIPSFAQTAPDQPQASDLLPVRSGIDESTIILGDVPDSQAANGGSSIFLLLQMVLVLALAALAIYGVVFFIKRVTRPRENPDPHLKVLARVPLASDSFAAVISLGAKAWLVGGGSGGVNLISEVDDAESLETMLLEDAGKNADTRRGMRRFFDFSSLLPFGRNEKKAMTRGSSHAESGYPMDSLRKQRERLKGL